MTPFQLAHIDYPSRANDGVVVAHEGLALIAFENSYFERILAKRSDIALVQFSAA